MCFCSFVFRVEFYSVNIHFIVHWEHKWTNHFPRYWPKKRRPSVQIATNQLLILSHDIGVINENFPSFRDKLAIFKSFLNVSSTYLSMKFFRFLEDTPVELQLRKYSFKFKWQCWCQLSSHGWCHCSAPEGCPHHTADSNCLFLEIFCSVLSWISPSEFPAYRACTSISQRPLDGGCHRRVNDGKVCICLQRDKVFPKLRIGETDNNSLGETASWEPPFKVLIFRTLSSDGRDSLWIVSCSLLSSTCSCPVLLISYRSSQVCWTFYSLPPQVS